MCSKNEEISTSDRVYFINEIVLISAMTKSGLGKDNAKVDRCAWLVYKYGRALWELLGTSNLLFIL